MIFRRNVKCKFHLDFGQKRSWLSIGREETDDLLSLSPSKTVNQGSRTLPSSGQVGFMANAANQFPD
jgi:hypothetical protein